MGEPNVDGFVANQSQKAPIVADEEIAQIISELDADEEKIQSTDQKESSFPKDSSYGEIHDHVIQGPAPVIGLVVDPKYGSCIKGVNIVGVVQDTALIKFALEVLAKSRMYSVQGLNPDAVALLDDVISGRSSVDPNQIYDRVRAYYEGKR